MLANKSNQSRADKMKYDKDDEILKVSDDEQSNHSKGRHSDILNIDVVKPASLTKVQSVAPEIPHEFKEIPTVR